MSEYLLRLEGVNLSSVLEDTNQLSVIRGGSLLLRQSIYDIADHFSKLEPISSGASAGLFRLQADAQEAEQVRDDIAAYLNCDPHYCHLTFVVDIQPAGEEFILDSEAVLARNRFRQLQQPTLALPPYNEKTDVAPCDWDGLRPGTVQLEVMRDGNRPWVSTSVQQRHNYGRDQKQRFYRRETAEPTLASLRFTNDLHDLSENSPFRNLDGKLAIIYLDGNGFTKLRETYCHTAEALRKFDSCVQDYRRQFLTAFLQHIKDDPHFKTDAGVLRLETLLWGGDELILVVPAWKGLQTLHAFYAQSEHWKFEGEPRLLNLTVFS